MLAVIKQIRRHNIRNAQYSITSKHLSDTLKPIATAVKSHDEETNQFIFSNPTYNDNDNIQNNVFSVHLSN